ncbi:MAG: hypothetical protein F7C32_04355 [Desulfurococcales archaeon]|nr:hypothetical protein [Desulfurococcales archaeon]
MDVTLEDVVKTYESGYASMEKLKRYTALGTGAEQGRFSAQISSIMLSHLKKIPLNRLGLFRSRPPHEMPTFGELAAVEVD